MSSRSPRVQRSLRYRRRQTATLCPELKLGCPFATHVRATNSATDPLAPVTLRHDPRFRSQAVGMSGNACGSRICCRMIVPECAQQPSEHLSSAHEIVSFIRGAIKVLAMPARMVRRSPGFTAAVALTVASALAQILRSIASSTPAWSQIFLIQTPNNWWWCGPRRREQERGFAGDVLD